MLQPLDALVGRARALRGLNLFVVILRIFLAFAFVPAGLKKVLGQPFTDPANTGPFHEFLHAFFATGAFYPFVGALQLLAAALLLSQRFATLGAALLAPILTAILAFCWSTRVYPTATVVTLMWLAVAGLLLWDWPKWRGVLASDAERSTGEVPPLTNGVDPRRWAICGFVVTGLYLLACALTGEVYRPKRGAEWSEPAFYAFPLMILVVGATLALDVRRHRRGAASAKSAEG